MWLQSELQSKFRTSPGNLEIPCLKNEKLKEKKEAWGVWLSVRRLSICEALGSILSSTTQTILTK